MSGGQFGCHHGIQAADGGKGVAADLVVVYRDAEAFFEGRDQGHHGHRVQFRDGAEQRRGGIELQCAAAKAEYFVQDTQDLGLGVHCGDPFRWQTTGARRAIVWVGPRKAGCRQILG